MKHLLIRYLDFKVDKLTRSIENAATGDNFPTEISYLTNADLYNVSKKNGWKFNWKNELKQAERKVFKLVTQKDPLIIQGLISVAIRQGHVYMHLIESAPFNRGKGKIYLGVPGNLVAYACRLSFDHGLEGYVSFHAKSKLLNHYKETLGAYHVRGHLMIINTVAAKILIERYFKT